MSLLGRGTGAVRRISAPGGSVEGETARRRRTGSRGGVGEGFGLLLDKFVDGCDEAFEHVG
jgi:hypothetical protein